MAKPAITLLLPAVVFVIAAGCTTAHLTSNTADTLHGVDGLTPGEVIKLPELTTLDGKTVALQNAANEKLLFVFFAPACSGCAVDVSLWKSLRDESAKRNASFYLIDVGQDRHAREKFIAAHNLGDLPILFDDKQKIGKTLKVNFVPQYLLVSNDGKVRHRWDGIRRIEGQPGAEELAKFFESGKDK